MKQLTKEQLTDLVYDIWGKVTEENAIKCRENISSTIKEANDLGGLIANVIVTYGTEIKKECCQTMAETIYDIFYSDNLRRN